LGSCRLDFEEMIHFFEVRYKGVFADIDKNQDGFITKEEYTNYLVTNGCNTGLNDIESYLTAVDADHNNQISMVEFAFGMLDLGIY